MYRLKSTYGDNQRSVGKDMYFYVVFSYMTVSSKARQYGGNHHNI